MVNRKPIPHDSEFSDPFPVMRHHQRSQPFTFYWISEELKKIKYKNNITFNLQLVDHEFKAVLQLELSTVCSRTSQPLLVAFRGELDRRNFLTEYDFYKYVRRRIHEVELHEADEFIIVDGKPIFDPHAGEDHHEG